MGVGCGPCGERVVSDPEHRPLWRPVGAQRDQEVPDNHRRTRGRSAGVPTSVSDPVEFVLVKVPQQLVHSLWFQSGWGQFNWPSWVNWTITVVVLVLIANLVRRYRRRDVLIVLGTLAVAGAALRLDDFLLDGRFRRSLCRRGVPRHRRVGGARGGAMAPTDPVHSSGSRSRWDAHRHQCRRAGSALDLNDETAPPGCGGGSSAWCRTALGSSEAHRAVHVHERRRSSAACTQRRCPHQRAFR